MTALFTGLCLLILGLALFCFVRYLRAHGPFYIDTRWIQDISNRRMKCITVGENGEQIGRSRWVSTPAPDRIRANGLNHIVKYVARLVKSRSQRASLIIASPEGNKAWLIRREEGRLNILESVFTGSVTSTSRKSLFPLPPHLPEPKREQAIRSLFAELGIAAEEDRVHEYNGYADAMRELQYPIGIDIAQATLIVQRLLREVYHVQEADGLDFTFEE